MGLTPLGPLTGELAWQTLWPDAEPSREWSHSGIAALGDGRIVFAEPGGHGLVFLDPESGERERVPVPTEDGHGITAGIIEGREVLWIADPGPVAEPGQVIRLDVETRGLDRIPVPESVVLAQDDGRGPWKPTATAEHDGALWVADGYGQSVVHVIRADGSTASFDGASSGVQFDCPHGVAIDDRGAVPLVVVADRGNRRLVFLDLDGRFVRSVDGEVMTSPSSIAVRGSELLVTDLFGALLAVDERDEVRALLPMVHAETAQPDGWPNRVGADGPERPPLVDGQLNSPHGIAVGRDGEIYLTEWLLGGRQIRLTSS